MNEPKLGPRERTQMSHVINRANEMLCHREDKLHLLCNYNMSVDSSEVGISRGEANAQAQRDDMPQ